MTRFWNGLVKGIADCIIYAGLDKILWKSFTVHVNLALCQTHCKQVPVFSRPFRCLSVLPVLQCLLVGQYGLCLLVICFRSTPPTFPHRQATFYQLWGQIWESLVFRLHSKGSGTLSTPKCPLKSHILSMWNNYLHPYIIQHWYAKLSRIEHITADPEPSGWARFSIDCNTVILSVNK